MALVAHRRPCSACCWRAESSQRTSITLGGIGRVDRTVGAAALRHLATAFKSRRSTGTRLIITGHKIRSHRSARCSNPDAGDTVPVIIDRLTGERREAQIFVAVTGASNFTYVEATWRTAGRATPQPSSNGAAGESRNSARLLLEAVPDKSAICSHHSSTDVNATDDDGSMLIPGGTRPRFRNDVAHHSEMISPTALAG